MEKCKFCDAQLEEGVMLCPNCGADNAEAEETAAVETVEETVVPEAAEETCEAAPAEETVEEAAEEVTEIKEGKKATPGKIALAVIAIVVLIAMIVGLLAAGMGAVVGNTTATTEETVVLEEEPTTPPTTPADGNPDDVTCKGTYTVSDEAAIAGADAVVATMGDKELTNAELQTYYWNDVNTFFSSESGYQIMMYGLVNPAQGLDTQISMADPGLTWQQYFLKVSLQNWQMMQALAQEAEAAGYTLDENAQKSLEAIPSQLEEMVKYYEMENVEQWLLQNFGAGVTLEDFIAHQTVYYQSVPYYTDEVSKFVFTDEEIAAFFDENAESYAQQGVTRDQKMVDVRHCLIMPEGATSATIRTESFSDEAWAASEKRANELLENWMKGDKSEESFAQMANENTDDGNDANGDGVKDGGLYTGVTQGQMVPEFENWCFDESRKPGDTGIVKTEFGYHIMYYVNGEAIWPYYAEQDLLAKNEEEFFMGVMEKHPMEVDYSAIQLAEIGMY